MVLFSYGSGLASAMYCLRMSSDASPKSKLAILAETQADIPARVKARKTVPPEEFEKNMKLREETHHLAPYKPVCSPAELFPGTYYLTLVDEKHRRTYERMPLEASAKVFTTLQSPLGEATANGSPATANGSPATNDTT